MYYFNIIIIIKINCVIICLIKLNISRSALVLQAFLFEINEGRPALPSHCQQHFNDDEKPHNYQQKKKVIKKKETERKKERNRSNDGMKFQRSDASMHHGILFTARKWPNE